VWDDRLLRIGNSPSKTLRAHCRTHEELRYVLSRAGSAGLCGVRLAPAPRWFRELDAGFIHQPYHIRLRELQKLIQQRGETAGDAIELAEIDLELRKRLDYKVLCPVVLLGAPAALLAASFVLVPGRCRRPLVGQRLLRNVGSAVVWELILAYAPFLGEELPCRLAE